MVGAPLRRHRPQVAHAEHHRQAADAAVVRPICPRAGDRAAEDRRSGEAVRAADASGVAGGDRSQSR